MPITYSTAYANYADTRYDPIRWLEEPGGVLHRDVYIDSNGYATIGAGFLVDANPAPILQGMALGLTEAQITAAATAISNATHGIRFAQGATGAAAALTAINNALRTAVGNNALNFQYATDTQIKSTFDAIVERYEDIVIAFLPSANRPVDNRERLTLLSLAYNGMLGKNGDGTWKSPSLRQALIDGDRAEAWFQMRYGSNPKNEPGVAKRRYYESSLFGLYADRDAPTEEESKQAFRTLQLHRADIIKYEKLHGLWIDSAGTYTGTKLSGTGKNGLDLANGPDYAGILGQLPVGHAENILESLTSAKNRLVTDLGLDSLGLALDDYLATSIYLDPGRNKAVDQATGLAVPIDPNHAATLDARTYAAFPHPDSGAVELASNDILIGEGGDDHLLGRLGNDILIGGTGSDGLCGGAGTDLYLFKSGDGADMVLDSTDDGYGGDGQGTLYFDGIALTGTFNQKDPDNHPGLFGNADWNLDFIGIAGEAGMLVITRAAGGDDRIVIPNFKSGNLGITLGPEAARRRGLPRPGAWLGVGNTVRPPWRNRYRYDNSTNSFFKRAKIFFTLPALCLVAMSAIFPLSARAEYVMTQGQGWRLCEALHKELKRLAPVQQDYCPVQMLRNLPGVTEPQWEELDVTKHEELLRKLVLYSRIGSHEAYFDPVRRAEALERIRGYGPFDKGVDNTVAYAKQGLVRFQVAHVNLLHADPQTGQPDPAPETIVRLAWTGSPSPGWQGDDARECMRRYQSNVLESPSDFIVKDDLSDFDQKRSGSVYFSASDWNMVLFYEGKEYMVRYSPSGNGFAVMRDAHDIGYVGPVCSIIHTIPKVSKGKQK